MSVTDYTSTAGSNSHCQNYVVAIDGQFELVYGTSCSSPVSGAIFTMINDARLAAGKGPIGFINPTVCPYLDFDARLS